MVSSDCDNEAVSVALLFKQDYYQLMTGNMKLLDVILTNNSDLILNISFENRLKQLHHSDNPPSLLKLSGLKCGPEQLKPRYL